MAVRAGSNDTLCPLSDSAHRRQMGEGSPETRSAGLPPRVLKYQSQALDLGRHLAHLAGCSEKTGEDSAKTLLWQCVRDHPQAAWPEIEKSITSEFMRAELPEKGILRLRAPPDAEAADGEQLSPDADASLAYTRGNAAGLIASLRSDHRDELAALATAVRQGNPAAVALHAAAVNASEGGGDLRLVRREISAFVQSRPPVPDDYWPRGSGPTGHHRSWSDPSMRSPEAHERRLYSDRMELVWRVARVFYRVLRQACPTMADVTAVRSALDRPLQLPRTSLRSPWRRPPVERPTLLVAYAVQVASSVPRYYWLIPPERGPRARQRGVNLVRATIACGGLNATLLAWPSEPPDARLLWDLRRWLAHFDDGSPDAVAWKVRRRLGLAVDVLDSQFLRVAYHPRQGPGWAAATLAGLLFSRSPRTCRDAPSIDWAADPLLGPLMVEDGGPNLELP